MRPTSKLDAVPAALTLGSGATKMSRLRALSGSLLDGAVLDLGARGEELAAVVRGSYVGVDIAPLTSVQADLGRGLPFSDRSFDAVFALDVFEHCDDIYGAFAEACRVCRRGVVLNLPNTYELPSRVRYAIGRRPSGKYGLPSTPPADRHRWLMGLAEAEEFVATRARLAGLRVEAEYYCYPAYRRPDKRAATELARRASPRLARLFARSYLAVLSR